MSMFSISGKVINTFMQAGRADRKTGEVSPDVPKVQILGDVPLSGGGTKSDLVTLTIPESIDLSNYQGKEIRLPLGVMAVDKNSLIYYIPKGSKILPPLIPQA